MEGTCGAKKRLEEFERVGEGEDVVGVGRATSGVVLVVAGRFFGWRWPGAMAVVGLAFLRVVQDLVSVVNLRQLSLRVDWAGAKDGTRLAKPLLCLSLVRSRGAIWVRLKCPFLVRLSDWNTLVRRADG